MEKQAYLILQDGTVFAGTRFGADGQALGEVVFTTAMTGYLEALTDPCYHGQILVQTFPLVGNYGVIPEDLERETAQVSAYIVREWCEVPSNFRSQGRLDAFMEEKQIIGLCGIDTRALTRKIREYGVMNGIISDSAMLTEEQKKALQNFQVEGAVQAVTCSSVQTYQPEGEEKGRIAVWDFGVKKSFIQKLQKKGYSVSVVPAGSTAQEIEALGADGLILSQGPGDPQENQKIVNQIKLLWQKELPMLGLGLGHQLMALSQGAKTEKLKHGHRGANQPVKWLETGKIEVTSQNHGYVVVTDSVTAPSKVCMTNVNDGSCEGIVYQGKARMSVQFAETEEILDAWLAEGIGGNANAAF